MAHPTQELIINIPCCQSDCVIQHEIEVRASSFLVHVFVLVSDKYATVTHSMGWAHNGITLQPVIYNARVTQLSLVSVTGLQLNWLQIQSDIC